MVDIAVFVGMKSIFGLGWHFTRILRPIPLLYWAMPLRTSLRMMLSVRVGSKRKLMERADLYGEVLMLGKVLRESLLLLILLATICLLFGAVGYITFLKRC